MGDIRVTTIIMLLEQVVLKTVFVHLGTGVGEREKCEAGI